MKQVMRMFIGAAVAAAALPFSAGSVLAEMPTEFVVGADPDYRPMSFSDEKGNEVGYDVDFATALAEHLDLALQYKTMAWDGVIPALTGDQIDAITSMVITPKRQEVVTFSQPVLAQTITTVARSEDPDFNPGRDDLAGLKVGVQVNTAAATALESVPGVEPVAYNSVADEYQDLILGRIDVVVIESINGSYTAASIYPDDLRVTNQTISQTPQYIAVAMRKEDTDLHDAVNAAIDAMQSDGTLAEIATKWFGGTGVLAE